ncbi:DinB family protein [Pedobacter endophyticus]|uniref:DinB family protein n=1 Tax=Pedobacter endophyticus TaxID=2789740 RepID=A0A7S9Q0H9_9SPHI|nr:DinB family protein [Pedobacter endophyticus]QPH40806.1 DinB family protein [Pedobacter endophyticus]
MEKDILITELKKLLNGGTAHVGLKDAVANLPFNLLGERPHQLPYSIWQLVSHIKIAQWDMLQFSKDGNHQSPKWPDEYWPKETAPKDENEWDETIAQIDSDLNEFIQLVENEDLFAQIPHGDGQSILREAFQIADHNAYHVAEIVVIRRLLGAWKN